ncbi:hypothetical protein TNCV_1404271 [Trichonephila clavipes]|nr:hypothetical protein TNCV_1404271 [Trichonephila clavipes]
MLALYSYIVYDASIRDPSTNPLWKFLGYQFTFFTTNTSEEESRDVQIKLLYIVEVFSKESRGGEEINPNQGIWDDSGRPLYPPVTSGSWVE